MPYPITSATPDEDKAWQHKLLIEQHCQRIQYSFLEIGRLLKEAKDDRHYLTLHYDTFQEYVEEIKLPVPHSYSWAIRLINIWEVVALPSKASPEALVEIGVTKLARILPTARKTGVTEELLTQARELSERDLRITLGHRETQLSEEDSINCPTCGTRITGAKWTSKKSDSGG